jgi:uncharacterized membrane protein YdjX (TVP38/TMEM64 family)
MGEAQNGGRRVVSVAVVVALAVGGTAAVIAYRHELWALFGDPERLRAWVSSFGVLAPLVFVGLQVLQVVVFVIPGEVPQIAGGYLFGALQGTLLSIAGIAAGSTVCFWLARGLGVPFVGAFFDSTQVSRMRALASSPRSRIVFFLLFVIPGIPKDILCYVAGLSAMRFGTFFFVSLLGRLPGILGSAVMGDAAAGRRWLLAGIVGGSALVLFVAGYLLRERIARWLEKVARRSGG